MACRLRGRLANARCPCVGSGDHSDCLRGSDCSTDASCPRITLRLPDFTGFELELLPGCLLGRLDGRFLTGLEFVQAQALVPIGVHPLEVLFRLLDLLRLPCALEFIPSQLAVIVPIHLREAGLGRTVDEFLQRDLTVAISVDQLEDLLALLDASGFLRVPLNSSHVNTPSPSLSIALKFFAAASAGLAGAFGLLRRRRRQHRQSPQKRSRTASQPTGARQSSCCHSSENGNESQEQPAA